MAPAAALSVTEVRNALRCPRVFALGRLRRAAVAFPVGSSCLGGAFHRIVERFAGSVASPPAHVAALAADAPPEAVCAAMVRWVLAYLADELERDPSYRTMPAETDDLAEALRQFAGYVAERLPPGPPGRTVAELVRAAERSVEAPFAEAGIVLRGKVDALFARGAGRLDVVEYKLTDEDNHAVDRAQVALYREMLRRSERIEARPVVLRFHPGLEAVELREEHADELVRGTLVPLLARMAAWAEDPAGAPATSRRDLCAACPLAAACAEQYPARLPARDDPPMAASRQRPEAGGRLAPAAPVQPATAADSDRDGRDEARAVQKRILEELRRDGVAAESSGCIVGARKYFIPISRPRGRLSDLDAVARNVEHRLATRDGIEAKYVPHGALRQFEVTRTHPRTVLLGPLLERKRAWLAERPGRFVVGEQPDGSVLCGDLADSATPHLLVAGQAGSGKSWLLRSLVASLVHWHDPSALRITLLDPKRVTFCVAGFQTAVAAHLDGPLLYGVEDALPCLERHVEVMEERYRMFEAANVSDLNEYNDRPGADRLPRHVVVVDEFGDLMVEKAAAQAFCGVVQRLGAKARAAGVHLVLATQRPDAKTMPPVLKANLGGRIALKVASGTNSRIILDQNGAETLLGRGDLLADLGQGVVPAQAAVVTL